MQVLKASVWLSGFLTILQGFLLCDCVQVPMVIAAFAVPGVAVKSFRYKVAGAALVIVNLTIACVYYRQAG